MRALFACISLAFPLAAIQVNAAEQKGFLVKTAFEYQGKDKTSKSESTFILDAKNKAWTTLTEPKDGIALLGRMTSSSSKSIEMEYIVVDTTQKNAVISTPAIKALLGELAKIEVGEKNSGKVSVSLLAQPTAYTSKN
ncbi:MAG: hypothetical protein K2Q26_03540 [Bdellovibrionales bacterium]|nr:hypothetical protein [Bdellovibrionales bacterium]